MQQLRIAETVVAKVMVWPARVQRQKSSAGKLHIRCFVPPLKSTLKIMARLKVLFTILNVARLPPVQCQIRCGGTHC